MTGGDKKDYNIVIAGGGFVGLALARALSFSAAGALRLAVIDQYPLPDNFEVNDKRRPFDGRASAISAASKEMLQVLGVWSRVAEHVQPITHIEITDSSLEQVLRPVLLSFDGDIKQGEPASYMVENRHLLGALAASVHADDTISYLAPERVTNFTANNYDVTIDLADSSSLSAKLLVAADGRKSALRKTAGIKTVGWSYPQTGIVTTVEHEKPHGGRAMQHFLPAGPFAILPLKGNRASLVWTEEKEKGRAIMAMDDEAFLQELTLRFGHKLGGLELAGPRGAFPLDMHIARSFVANRFALIGDAAHGVHPIAGMGLNIGLRDVAALTQVVIESMRLGLDVGCGSCLEHYERWRRFDSAFSAVVMDGLNRLFSNDSAPLRALRDFGLGVVDRFPGLKQFFVQEAAGISGEVPRLLRGELI